MTEGWLREGQLLSLSAPVFLSSPGRRFTRVETGAGFSDDLDAAPGQELVLC